MLRRTYLGLEVRDRALRAVAIQRRGSQIALTGGQTRTLDEGILKPDFREPNVIEPERFISGLKQVMGSLVRRENRIAVALPDRSGQIFLLDVETPFKNRKEGTEIIRWRLKDLLPDKARQVALDFQVVEERESGQKRILAAAMSKTVLDQYEALFEQAGFAASVIDFHSLALYNAYRSKIDLGRDFILIGVDGRQLSMLMFVDQTLRFYRSRTLSDGPQQVFQELNRSLLACRQDLPGFSRMPVHLHSDWPERDGLHAAVDAAFEQDVQWLVSPVSKLLNGHQVNFAREEASGMAASLGVAERMIQRAN